MLITDLNEYAKKNRVIILGGNETTSEKVCELLKEREVNYKYEKEMKSVNPGEIIVTWSIFCWFSEL